MASFLHEGFFYLDLYRYQVIFNINYFQENLFITGFSNAKQPH